MAGKEAGCIKTLEFVRGVHKLPRRKTAGTPFCARARDRKGAEQTRRGAPGPERSGALDSPVPAGGGDAPEKRFRPWIPGSFMKAVVLP
jgi:hypothetical protein